MNLKLDNFLLFNNFEINMSYPKKIVGSSLKEEHLANFPNFRYKKLIILMGANASGKTALGRILMGIYNFILNKEYGAIVGLIEDKEQLASLEMDFVVGEKELYRLIARVSPNANDYYESNDIQVCVKKTTISSSDNYEKCSIRLNSSNIDFGSNYISELEKIPPITWMFEYPFASEGRKKVILPVEEEKYGEYLKTVLSILDPRISDVKKIDDSKGTYIIIRNGKGLVMENGELSSPEKLSSGTLDGIGVANILTVLKLHAAGFYYCDEKFSHIHSEYEKAFLSILADGLGSNEQLFYTTHNTDVLDMDFPLHSYAFMRRDTFLSNYVSCIYASDYIKKNDVSLKAAVENDVFSANPDVSEIFNLFGRED